MQPALGRLAQLVEHALDVRRVSGSSPLSSTRKETPFVYRTKGVSFGRNKSLAGFVKCSPSVKYCSQCEMHCGA